MSTNHVLRRIAVLFIGTAAATSIAACGSSSTSSTVSGKDVAKEGAAQFTKQFKAKFTMSCPHDMKAKKGATTRCVTTNPAGVKIGTTVTITSVRGSHVEFDFQNDNHPLS